MGMQVGDKKGGAMGDINVTPLVDVVLVLLIIFMVVTQMLSSGMDVKLPKARTSVEVRDMGQYLVLSIIPSVQTSSIPNVYIDRSQINLDELMGEIRTEMSMNNSQGLILKGSKRLTWKEAYKVMNTISEGGINTMLLATDKEK